MTGTQVLGSFKQLARRGAGAPVMMLVMLAMMMLPLPPFLLDMLFSFNIALSLVILLAVVYVMRPLEFAAFPTVVLMATLLVHDLYVGPPDVGHPWQAEAHQACHGGLWRAAFAPRSALGLAALLGYGASRP